MKFVRIKLQGAGREPEGTGEEDRRAHRRIRTLDRTVRVTTMRDAGLCRLMNISDQGTKLATGLTLSPQEAVTVTFSDTLDLSGHIVWTRGEECGLRFDERVNCMLLLRHLAEDQQVGWSRPPRLPLDTGGIVYSELGAQAVRVLDISQNGMKVAHAQVAFEEGLIVQVHLDAGLERRGIVRWNHAGAAGVRVLKPFDRSDLASARRFAAEDLRTSRIILVPASG